MGLIIRILLIAGGAIAGLFAAKETYHYSIYQMIFGILIIAVFLGAIAYGPAIIRWIRGKSEDDSSQ